jgi:hypothetical protein
MGILIEKLRKATETLSDEGRFINLTVTNVRALLVRHLVWVTPLCYQTYAELR